MALVVVVAVGGAAGYAWYLNREIHRIDVRGLTDVPTSGADAGTENILLVGSTDRCALKVQNAAYGLCSAGRQRGQQRRGHAPPPRSRQRHTVSILSVPRDLFVPNARTTGANKIDAALYQGPSQLVAAINEDLGIPVQHYVVLNFDSFANVVDALGGVKMYFPEPVYDAYSGLQAADPGVRTLNGVHALQVVRARHLQYKGPGITTNLPEYWPSENLSDLARIRRDHEFLRVLATAVAKQGLSDPITDERLVSRVAPQLEVDRQFSTSDMVDLVLNFHSVNVDPAPQLTLPVEVDQYRLLHLQGSGVRGHRVPLHHPGPDRHRPVPRHRTHHRPHDRPDAPRPGHRDGVGAQRHRGLQPGHRHLRRPGRPRVPHRRDRGHPVGGQPVGDGGVLRPKTAADQAAAQAVAHSLSGAVITALGPTSDGAQVTVVTGTQFSVAPPPTAPAATGPATPAAGGSITTPATTPTTTPTTTLPASSASTFLPPTAAVTPLQPWDPRSCTPEGGEGT